MTDSAFDRYPKDSFSLEELTFDNRGLIPAVVQDVATGEVLMVAFMNRQSLQRTLETGETWFYSRSRGQLWNKGATSGNRQRVKSLRTDCDRDCLLIEVEQMGDSACHVPGNRSCFSYAVEGADFSAPASFRVLPELARVIAQRHRDMPEGSYTTTLFRGGVDRIAKKVGEEAVEVVIGAKNHALDNDSELPAETADLLYHLIVLAESVGLSVEQVYAELNSRRPKPVP